MNDLAQKAILSALSCEWEKAVTLNKKILKENSKDVDALNRLARAYAELGKLKKAKTTAKKVTKIDPFNNIALKSLSRWKNIQKGKSYSSNPTKAQAFLEEPGKTKMVCLMHLGGSEILAKVDAGDEVLLNTHSHRVGVTTSDGKYIGRLPDNLSARLRKLISLGNEYQTLVKSITCDEVKVFIKEVKRSPKLADIPSFSGEKIDYISFTPPELVHKNEKPDVTSEDEKEE
jgi:tetratricopeptide (TPR) repeat protein